MSRWGAEEGIRSVDSIPGALANRHKYTSQEHRVAETKRPKGRNRKISRVTGRNEPKMQKTDVQTKDVEARIKTYDGIVERRGR